MCWRIRLVLFFMHCNFCHLSFKAGGIDLYSNFNNFLGNTTWITTGISGFLVNKQATNKQTNKQLDWLKAVCVWRRNNLLWICFLKLIHVTHILIIPFSSRFIQTNIDRVPVINVTVWGGSLTPRPDEELTSGQVEQSEGFTSLTLASLSH